jgi:tRNA G18 (ribose-2'-O)-methylase SpoU
MVSAPSRGRGAGSNVKDVVAATSGAGAEFFLVEGRKHIADTIACLRALKPYPSLYSPLPGGRRGSDCSPPRLEKVFVCPTLLESSPDGLAYLRSLEALLANGTPGAASIERLSAGDFRRLSEVKTPQGVVALLRRAHVPLDRLRDYLRALAGPGATRPRSGPEPSLRSPHPLLLVLSGLQDPGNVGTLIRTAHACGVTAVVSLEDASACDPYSPKVVRATAASVAQLPIVRTDTASFLSFCSPSSGVGPRVALVGSSVSAATGTHYRRFPWAIPAGSEFIASAVCVGSEGRGLCPLLDAAISPSQRVVVPMAPGTTESLNVGVAGSLLLYEAAFANGLLQP